MNTDVDLKNLILNLPIFLQNKVNKHPCKQELIEIVLDLGRRPEARFKYNSEYLSQKTISWQDIDYTTKQISKFSNENRAGINRTLHRISCIRNRQYLINGLTCRVGRALFGTISVIRDLLELNKSILILGKPGVGKTTIVREIGRILANEMEKRVIIIDTSNEIAGDSDVPHSGIGRARRMQVEKTELQHQVMIEAVENHMPQVIIVDEIGTELEVLAARTIAEKGVQLVGTTHGNCLENVIKNPPLTNLIGGVQHVTLSDEEAKRRKTQKSILERKSYPAFEIIIEINTQNTWTIHENVQNSVDFFLRNNYTVAQLRYFFDTDQIRIRCRKLENCLALRSQKKKTLSFQMPIYHNWTFMNQLEKPLVQLHLQSLIIYPYSLSNNLLREVLSKIGIKYMLTHNLKEADVILGLKKHFRTNLKLKKLAKKKNIPVYTLNQVSFYQVTKLVRLIS